jgi:hypothetical protein
MLTSNGALRSVENGAADDDATQPGAQAGAGSHRIAP